MLGLMLGCMLVVVAVFAATNVATIATTKDRIVEPQAAVGFDADAIVVLGASVFADGTPSGILRDRLDDGIALYKEGVAPKLIMSGDNSTVSYNEVQVMKDYAISQGVPSYDIFCDHAGFSTYESMYRAKHVFGAERIVLAINERNSRGQRGFQPMATLVREVSEKIIDLYQNQQGSEVTGVPTGYPNLDRELAGLQRGDLIIIAGRPSMGKTSFAINIAENVGVRQELPVAVFSLEMGGDQLAQRLISSVANIDAQKLRKAQLEDEEWNAFSKAVHRLENKPIYIDDTPALMISELSSRARQL